MHNNSKHTLGSSSYVLCNESTLSVDLHVPCIVKRELIQMGMAQMLHMCNAHVHTQQPFPVFWGEYCTLLATQIITFDPESSWPVLLHCYVHMIIKTATKSTFMTFNSSWLVWPFIYTGCLEVQWEVFQWLFLYSVSRSLSQGHQHILSCQQKIWNAHMHTYTLNTL